MPIQTYCCPDHKKFEVMLRIGQEVPKEMRCPVDVEADGVGGVFCDERSPWVPPTVSFPGGPTTGARPPILREDDNA